MSVAMSLAQRLREGVGQLKVPIEGGHAVCTGSVSASFAAFEAWEAAKSQAAEALYRAKAVGRDGV